MRVVTGGTFDLIHFGHVLHLQTCAALAGSLDEVVVMLVTDEWGKSRKRQPILTYPERYQMLLALGVKQIVPVNAPEELLDRVKELNPEIYVYEFGTNSSAHQAVIDYYNDVGIGLVNLNKVPKNPFGTSTTSIIERINALSNNSDQ